MRRATVLLTLALALPAGVSLAQGPYPAPQPVTESGTELHRAGAAASSNGTTEATLAPSAAPAATARSMALPPVARFPPRSRRKTKLASFPPKTAGEH